MATTSNVYPNYSQYKYSSNNFTNGADHIFTGGGYQSRLRFNYNLGEGKKIKITSGYLYLYRNDGGTAKPTVYARFNANTGSVPQNSATFSADTGGKTITFSSALLNSVASMNGAGNFYIYISSSSSVDTRYTGHDNPSYGTGMKPRLVLTWDYDKSSGSLGGFATSANYMDAISFNISLASSKYTHKVDWYFNGETTPYFTETLAAGQKISTCSFFGDNPSGAVLNEKTYFTNVGDSVPFSVTLTTYNESGASLGTTTYSSTLVYSDLINTCSINTNSLVYGEPFDIKLTARIAKTTVINHYIGDKVCRSETFITDMTHTFRVSYPIDEVYNYFSYYKKEEPFKLETITYNEDGTEAGSQIINLTITHEPIKKLIEINHDIIVSTDTIISNNYFDNAREIFSNSLTRLKSQLIDLLHPVGSIYISYDSTNPSELFGGTWEAYSLARTLYSTTTESSIGTTGGSFTHTLTEAQMPSHNHKIPYTADVATTGGSTVAQEEGYNNTNKAGSAIGSSGSGSAHVNTQPYSACYIWKRIL